MVSSFELSRGRYTKITAPLVCLAMVLALWQMLVEIKNISPLLLPPPSAIAGHLLSHATDFASDGSVTLLEAAGGLAFSAVVAIIVATAMVHSPLVRWTVEPLHAALRCVPIVAIAPGLALWLGFGYLPKLIVVTLISLPPLLINAATGLSKVDSSTLEVFRSLNASKVEIFTKLRVPQALPSFFAGLKVSVTLSLIGAVVAEWSGSSEGLGYRIIRAQKDLETTTVWSSVFALSLLGMALVVLVVAVERRVLRWRS